MCCVRCGTVVLAAQGSTGAGENDRADRFEPPVEMDQVPEDVNPLAVFDTWELDEQLRHVERVVSGSRFSAQPAAARDERRFDLPLAHAAVAAAAESTGRVAPCAGLRHRKPLVAFAAWTILACGLAVFTCGAVLTGWSIVEARADLWNIGLPAALTGLLGLLLGLVLQLEVVCHAQRVLSADLTRLEHQLRELSQRLSAARAEPSALAPSSWADDRVL